MDDTACRRGFFAHVLISLLLVFHTVLQIRKSSCVGTWDLISIWAGPDSKGRSRSFCIGNTKYEALSAKKSFQNLRLVSNESESVKINKFNFWIEEYGWHPLPGHINQYFSLLIFTGRFSKHSGTISNRHVELQGTFDLCNPGTENLPNSDCCYVEYNF